MAESKELTTRETADMLGRHICTVKRWIHEAIAGDERQFAADDIRVDMSGKQPRYYVRGEAVRALVQRAPSEYF